MTERMWAKWCWIAKRAGADPGRWPPSRAAPARCFSAQRVDQYRGCRSWTILSGRTSYISCMARTCASNWEKVAGILEVPDVGGEMNVISPRECRGAFQVSAQAEHHSLDRGGRGDEPGHEAARPPQEERAGCGPCPNDGVVCPGDDGPVVHEEPVRHFREHLQRLQGISDDGLVGPVAGGHDEAAVRDLLARQLEKKDVQGRVGEHEAEGVRVGDRQQLGSRHRGVLPAGDDHDRALGRGEYLFLLLRETAQGPGFLEISDHQREGLAPSLLCSAKPGHRAGMAGVGGKVKPSDALHGDDEPFPERGDRNPQGVARQFSSVSIEAAQPGAARRARIGLGVEPPVERVLVFLPAGGALAERLHGRRVPVERGSAQDGIPGPALRAGDEWVQVAPVGRIEKLAPAVGADGKVRGHGGEAVWRGAAFQDTESGLRRTVGREIQTPAPIRPAPRGGAHPPGRGGMPPRMPRPPGPRQAPRSAGFSRSRPGPGAGLPGTPRAGSPLPGSCPDTRSACAPWAGILLPAAPC